MIALSARLAKGQKNAKDYYLGGNNLKAFPIAISTMATQCSTTSILGAPAFVAFSMSGGLYWLQYELAIPFAMIFLMAFILPFYRNLGIISVYEYLERRFDRRVRVILSIFFQVMRAFAAGVIIYGISIVISYCTGLSFVVAVVLLGVITVVYDFLGGMKAVIVSDVIQMIVLYVSILITIFIAVDLCGGLTATLAAFDDSRKVGTNYLSSGFDGNSFGFWPMMFGGFFLYISYYGCDQTQVQRELSTQSVDDTNLSLFINGILRFPLALTYCFLGVCIGAFATLHPDFFDLLPVENGTKNLNMAVPVFVLKHFPVGVIGVFLVGLFSAAMSSLDSTLNSLSATSLQDLILPLTKKPMSEKQQLWASKLLTVFWGAVCTGFSFGVGGISDSVVVSINKIGSLASGPILGVFLLGLLTTRVGSRGAICGFLVGFALNLGLWLFVPLVAWPWWNVVGCLSCLAVGLLMASLGLTQARKNLKDVTIFTANMNLVYQRNWPRYYWVLGGWGLVILALSSSVEFLL